MTMHETSAPLIDGCTVQKFLADTGISKSTFYRHVADGRLTLLRAGGLSMVDGESARRWFSSLQKIETPRSKRSTRP